MFLSLAYAHAAEIQDLAQDLHRHPELSMQEIQTTEKLRCQLSALGVELIDLDHKVGVVGILHGDYPGPLIALRADIDAITQHENDAHPLRSEVPNVMHGCGHDIHTAALWGCALLLAENTHLLHGDVMLIFQPAEETLTGARYLLDHGLFARYRPAAIFGLHNDPTLDIGKIGIKEGPLMAFKDSFRIRYIGKSGHSSTPQANIDPTVAIAALVMALQTIVSRNVSPLETAVLSVTALSAGNPYGTTVEDGQVVGDIRTLHPAVRQVVQQRLRTIAENTAAAYGCQAEITLTELTPGIINGPSLLPVARQAAARTLDEACIEEPIVNLGAEDFAVLSTGLPSFFYFVGSGIPGKANALWHSADFQAHPDTPLVAAALLAQTVIEAQQHFLSL